MNAKVIVFAAMAALAISCGSPETEEMPPYVYTVENTEAAYVAPEFNPAGLEAPMEALPNPFLFNNGKEVEKFADWSKRRAEISASVQYYEIGTKPAVNPKDVKAEMAGDTLKVSVSVNGETLYLSSVISYPSDGPGPFPLMMGTSHMSLPMEVFEDREIAIMNFNERQVVNYGQFGPRADRGAYEFERLYPELVENGAYADWSWGVSRLIDGLQILGPEVTRIDTEHIGVTGCSYAGKMALFAGAFDERIALTIAQEPGGGGAASWRVSRTLEGVEDLDHTDYHWFKESMRETFAEDKVQYLPHDRHELCAMVCPRALLILGNTDYQWLADESGYVSANAARKVWEKFGIGERMGYSIEGQHPHCLLPESQYPHVQAFIDRYLLGLEDVATDVRYAPMFEEVDLDKWITY